VKYESGLEKIYVIISDKRSDYEDIKSTINAGLLKKHKIIFNSLDGYHHDKDIIISDGLKHSITIGKDICEDVGVGKEYRGSAAYVVYDYEDITDMYCEHIYARKTHTPAYILETNNYIVREECENDLEELYRLYDTLSDCPFIEPLYEAEREKEFLSAYISNMYGFFDYGMWLVFDKKTGELVGRMGIENRSIDGVNCQELGYLVGRKYQRRRIAYEVCSKIVEYARESLCIDRLYACIHKDNIPSINFINKMKFKLYAKDIDDMDIYVRQLDENK